MTPEAQRIAKAESEVLAHRYRGSPKNWHDPKPDRNSFEL